MRRHLCSRQGVLRLVGIATAIKLLLALLTHGTNDVNAFYRFGNLIADNGLGAMYRADPEFNHVPLTALLSVVATQLDGFAFWIRVPGIAADIGTVAALLRLRELTGRPPWWALALFAISPVSLLVSGFHGNVDPIMAMAMTWALVATVEGRPIASAVWLALAVNVKVAALLLAPLLILIWWQRHGARRFLPTFVGLTLLGWAPALVVAPREFIDQVLGYASRWGSWGIPLVASRVGGESWQPLEGFDDLTAPQGSAVDLLRLMTIAGALTLAWRGRHRSDAAFELAAATWAVFFVFATGVGPQYLVWMAPMALVALPAAYVGITIASTTFLVAFYGITSRGNWFFAHSTPEFTERWEPWTLLPWFTIAAAGLAMLRSSAAQRT